ncbi:hypothetical protein D770_14940 [Flammeovirgaceae bacterium 311]|nr:hypothetical protein D770_14940 [Flammeovirgaceae bacterium 311]
MKRVLHTLILVLAVAAFGCSSGKKAWEQGNYYEASMQAINRLKQKPDHKKASQTLRQAYPMALEALEADIIHLKTLNTANRWGNIVSRYEQLNALYDAIRYTPGALQVVPVPKPYHAKLQEAREQAAAESYTLGQRELSRGSREAARQAYEHFRSALHYVPGYRDSEKKLQEAHYLATLKVLVEQIPVPGRYSLDVAFFNDQIESYLHNAQQQHGFIRFYSLEEANAEKLSQPDHYVRIQFEDFVIGETHIKELKEQLKRDSVRIGEVKVKPDSLVPVYGTVEAKLTTFRKEVISRGRVSMYIVDARTNAVLQHRQFPGEFVWFSEWGFFNGDERALEPRHKKIVQLREVPPPPPQDMFAGFAAPIFSQLTDACRGFYARY